MAEVNYEELEFRRLNTKDFWGILQIFRKGGKEAFGRLNGIDKVEGDDQFQYAAVIIDVGMEYAEKDLKILLADIAGLTVEEYDNGPFDLSLTILEHVQEKEDFSDFFKRAASFIKKFSKDKK